MSFVCVQTCDDLEDEESLKHLYHIMKGAIMLNSNRRLPPQTSIFCEAQSLASGLCSCVSLEVQDVLCPNTSQCTVISLLLSASVLQMSKS